MNKKRKKFKEKYLVEKLNPIMPENYSAAQRAKLRKWEKEILEGNKQQEESIGKEPGE